MKICFLFLVCVASILASTPSFARQKSPVAVLAKSVAVAPLLDQAKTITDSKDVTQAKYPDAESVLISEYVRTEYKSDGSFVTLDEDYVKVLTEAGRKAAQRELAYNVFYGGLEIIAAEVIKADGHIVKHDVKSVSKEQVDRSQMEENIYDPNDKVTVAAVPGVEIGDTIRFFVKRWESKPRMKGCYSDWSMLEGESPMRQITYEYIAPKDSPLKSKALLGDKQGGVTMTEEAEGDKIRYVWTGRDIPQAFLEPAMPNLQTVGQRLLVSTVGDWKEISRWYYEISKGHLAKITPGMKAKTKKLTAKATTDREKIEAIFKFVSQEIRYMGITTEQESPGYEPHDVNITFEKRYGVCRDKAALLVSMLNEAGIPAFPVIIMVGEKLDREVPSANFNHAITAARTKEGSYVLMDSTNESTPDLMPEYLYNRSYLVATPEGETLMTSPVSPVEENMAVAGTTVKLADDGSATGITIVDLKGINDVSYRGSLAEMKPDDIRRSFEGSVKSTIPGATVTSFKLEPEDMQDTTRNLRFSIGWSVPDILVTGGDAAQLQLPFVGYGFGEAIQLLGESLQLDHRRFPLNLDMTCGTREELTIALPPTLAKPISLPNYQNTEHKDFSFNKTISVDGGVLKAVIDVRLKSPFVEPADYLILKQAMAKVEENSRQQPIFSLQGSVRPARHAVKALPVSPAAAVTSDVEILKSRCDVRVENACSWSTRLEVKQKILTYAGKKSNSDLKFDFNPVWETVQIEYAKVTQNDGTVRKLQPQEINTLDASWVASAPRYPGGKTLVVSLPGVEVGSMVEYAVKTTVKDQPMFQSAHTFTSPDIIKEMEFSYDLPEHLNPTLLIDFPKDGHLTDVVKGGRRKLSFKWRDIMPQATEKEAPPSWVDAPNFAMSTGKWSDYAIAVGARVSPLLENQSASVAKARELASRITEPLAKLVAIRDFVARQIRNPDLAFTEFPLATAFSPADVTLKDGYGHSADRAILLQVMLKAAGLECELALASDTEPEPTLLKRFLELPENGAFDNLVCRVKHPATGEWLPLDLLSQYAPPGVTRLDRQPGYSLDGKLFTWSAPSDRKDVEETRIALDFDAEGTALITITKQHHGKSHEEFVAKYSEMTPEERKRDFQGLVSNVAQNATPQGDLITDFVYPGTLEFTVRVPHYGVKSEAGLYFDLPDMPEQWVMANSNTRQHPLLISSDSQSRFVWSITAPGGLKPIIQPETFEWSGPTNCGSARFTVDAHQADGKTLLNYTLNLDTSPTLVPASNYPQLLEMNRRLGHAAARRILLR